MSGDIVFKFVTLRAPTALSTDAPAHSIEPTPDDLAVVVAGVDAVREGTSHRERLTRFADTFVDSAAYLFNNDNWRQSFGGAAVASLMAASSDGADEFRARADSVLRDAAVGEATFTSWDSRKLRQAIWAGYLASIFSSTDRGHATRYFLDLVRVAFAYQQTRVPGFDLTSLDLTRRRAAIPASIIIGNEAGSPGNGIPPPPEPPSEDTRLGEEIVALSHALNALGIAKQQKLRQLVTQTKLAHKIRLTAVSGGHTSTTGRSPKTISFQDTGPEPPAQSSLQHLRLDEISDKAAVRTLVSHGLDPAESFSKIRTRLGELIAARVAHLSKRQERETIAWENGAFVRLRHPPNIAGI